MHLLHLVDTHRTLYPAADYAFLPNAETFSRNSSYVRPQITSQQILKDG